MFVDEDVSGVLDSLCEGIVYIDSQGIIQYANNAYKKFLLKEKAIKPDEQVEGTPLKKYRPDSRLHEVLKSGKSILHAIRREHKEIYFANFYPVKKKGIARGAVSVITFVQQAYDFNADLENYERHTKQIMRSANKANTARWTFDSIIAASPASREVKTLAKRIAKTDSTVLLQSESGTGKELYAQAIHNASPRANELFVAINCANFNADLLDAELFGYEQGTFTGALKEGKVGLFEAANRGTLFLDEVSEMPLALQAKLLRVLQERRFRKVGGVREIDIDVRIVAACNANLAQYIKDGKFRKDLFYRLNVFSIRIPPLRERISELGAFTEQILSEFSQKLKKPVSITPKAMHCLKQYNWPGNVRELRNVLESAGYLSENAVIDTDALPGHISKFLEIKKSSPSVQLPVTQLSSLPPLNSVKTLSEKILMLEKWEIERAISQFGGDLTGKKKAALSLGISIATLYKKINS